MPSRPAWICEAHVEIGIGRRLADAVLQARRRIASLAEHAHHHAAIVARPDRAIGRERVGPVALVAVDGRRGESRGRVRVREQAAEEVKAGRGKSVALAAGEGVDLAAALEERLMQMPAAGEQIGQCGPAHEAGEKTVAARDLLGGGAEQHHRVGGGKSRLRAEGELALARAQFDFERAQRHVERNDAAPDRRQGGIELIEARLGQILIALIEQAHLGRPRRPGRILGGKPRILQLEEMEFDLEPGAEIEARCRKLRQGVAQNLPRRERHRSCRPRRRCRTEASRCSAPMAARGRSPGRRP